MKFSNPRFTFAPKLDFTVKSTISISLILFTLLAFGNVAAQAEDDTAKKLLALIDYIGGDYKNAVEAGKVRNPNEYQEQLEFARRSLELFDQVKKADSDKASIESDLKVLVKHVEDKADPKTVTAIAHGIEKKIIDAYGIVPYPRQLPSLAAGRQLFMENCAQCHGPTGKGDGPGRESMNPKQPLPANFTDAEFMAGLSPFKAFNAISFGVDNTAMASFAALSEAQRWELAFYVLSLRFPADAAKTGEALMRKNPVPPELMGIATVSSLTNEELAEKLKEHFRDEADTANVLAYLRRGLLEKASVDPLLIARSRIHEATELYKKGQKETAYQKAVEAYLEGLELVGPALFAKNNTFGRDLETKFTQFRNAIKQGLSIEEIEKQQGDLDAKLDEATQILSATESYSSAYFFSNSLLIILREGLEAALILGAILAMLKVTGATHAIYYIHLGWILALLAGALTWLATQSMLTLSGQHRESMEGFISIFAAIALFYVGYWLHTRSEAKKWRDFIQHQVTNVVSSKKIFGLVGISFFTVYREAFEVVLFYEALWLQNGADHGAILWGFVSGAVALAVVAVAILKLGLKIPLKYFFVATGTLLYIMAFIFVGNGIKELQAAGWVPSTPLSFVPQLPLLGIYPTLQTLAAQAVMLVAFMMTTIFLMRGRSKA